jgi:hypothetical protein
MFEKVCERNVSYHLSKAKPILSFLARVARRSGVEKAGRPPSPIFNVSIFKK